VSGGNWDGILPRPYFLQNFWRIKIIHTNANTSPEISSSIIGKLGNIAHFLW
tara:strand:+ start:255 stop:410 length:156 start_codon:yes stop_codon:yes gene_type:complete